jgi:hypothetical protein
MALTDNQAKIQLNEVSQARSKIQQRGHGLFPTVPADM